jgi:hypothetical protein
MTQYVSVGANGEVNGNGSGSGNVAYPTGILAGELLLMQVYSTAFGNGYATTTPPSGWALKASVNVDSTVKQEVLWKVASGSETGNLSVTVTATGDFNALPRILRVTQVDTASPFESGGTESGTGTSVTADAVTSTVGGSMAFIFGVELSGNDFGQWTGESGGDYTIRSQFTAGLTIGFFAAPIDVGTISGGSSTITSAAWGTISFSVKAPPAPYMIGTALGGSAATTSTTITVPTVAVDDVLFVPVTNRGATAAPSVSDNDSGTWTRVDSGDDGLTGWYRRATSATSAKTVTVSGVTTSLATLLVAFRGCTTSGNPFENVTKESNSSGDESHAAITPGQSNSLVCLVVANRAGATTVATENAASIGPMLEFAERTSSGGGGSGVVCAGAPQGTAGTSGALTWAQTNAATISMAFDLIPDSGFATITGTMTTAAAAQTLAASGDVLVSGSVVTANAVQAFSSSGDVLVSGSVTTTAAAQAFAATGDVVLSGTMATSAAAQSFVASGDVLVSGTVATSAQAQALAASGNVLVSGTVATSAPAQVFDADGDVDGAVISGSLASSSPAQVFAGTGDVLVSGAVTTAAPAQALAASGGVLVSGSVATTAAAQAFAASADAVLTLTMATSAPAQALSATGTVLVSGIVATQGAAQVLSATGGVLVSGTMATSAAAQRFSAQQDGVVVETSWPSADAWPDVQAWPEELALPLEDAWP